MGTSVSTPWSGLKCGLGSRDSSSNVGFAGYLDCSIDFATIKGVREGEGLARFGVDVLVTLAQACEAAKASKYFIVDE